MTGRLRSDIQQSVAVVDDAVVIERSWDDPTQFGIIFERHSPLIYRYVARRVGHLDADDLVAETFVVAFRNRHRFDLARNDARPWLYGIATNVVGHYRRHELKQLRLSRAVEKAPTTTEPADRIAHDATAQSLGRELAIAMSRLAERDRDVLILIAWEELTYEEVAHALLIPIGTVRSRLHRARAQLRLVLDSLNTAIAIREVLTHE